MKYIPIAGTNSLYDPWYWKSTSPFQNFLRSQGFEVVINNGRYFRWSTDLAGLIKGSDRKDWETAGDALAYFLNDVDFSDRNLICHSHGGQVAIYCASFGIPIRSLTTVGTPIRYDVPVDDALKSIRHWQHIYDSNFDLIAWLGSIGDKHLDIRRYYSQGEIRNISVGGIRHSKVLRDENFIPMWATHCWLTNIINATQQGDKIMT